MLDSFKNLIQTNETLNSTNDSAHKILILFGTRPELIKLATVVFELKKHPRFQTVVVSSSQHTDLLTLS
ncbi:MAG: hypothetical protein M3388_09905 [Acidobacteriota bacterium]|nr:hypothetical protein [Acidobacteriota bacterium]